MKKLLGCFLCVMLLFCLATPAAADIMVDDSSAINGRANPEYFTANSVDVEEEWLENVMGLAYDHPSVDLVYRDDNPDDGWQIPTGWYYAVLKFGGPNTVPNHYAIEDTNNNDLIDLGDVGLADYPWGLSHITFDSASVPEPATMLLFGTGILCLGALGRKRFKV